MQEKVISGKRAEIEFERIKREGRIIFQTIVGSHSYGLNVETSDVDKKFVYIDSEYNVLTGNTIDQINVTDDFVGYEIGRFIELLGKQNPNLSEIAFSDKRFHEICSPLFEELIINNRKKFLSKKVAFSYGAYAHSQIKKAHTTSKKFMTDMSGPRKQVDEFTYIIKENNSIPFKKWIEEMTEISINEMVLSKVNHARETYAIHWLDDGKEHGIFSKNMDTIKLSSFPKDAPFITNVTINLDGFSMYCKEYKEWHEWNEKKNPIRFTENLDNDKKYDRKNMTHCHRLLNMCIEILETGDIKVLRTHDRDYLLGIRYGKETYQELVDLAEKKRKIISEKFITSKLPDEISKEWLEEMLYTFRKKYYKKSFFKRLFNL